MNRLIELSNLTTREANAVLDEMIDLDSRIFVHASEEAKARIQREMRDLTMGDKILVLYEEHGETVGYNLIKIQRLELGERVAWVVGSVAGFLPGHTGGNRTMVDAIHAMLRHKLGHPGREYFLVTFLISPAGYDMLVDLCPATFPSPDNKDPGRIEAELLRHEARRRGLAILADEPERLVVTAGRRGREPFERGRDSENIRFFEALNPRHAEGELLGVCVPLGALQLLGGAARLARRRMRKALSGKRR